jgi:hypothetical protein
MAMAKSLVMDVNAYLGLLSRVEADPIEVDWEVVESHVGIALPSDYKALAERRWIMGMKSGSW